MLGKLCLHLRRNDNDLRAFLVGLGAHAIDHLVAAREVRILHVGRVDHRLRGEQPETRDALLLLLIELCLTRGLALVEQRQDLLERRELLRGALLLAFRVLACLLEALLDL